MLARKHVAYDEPSLIRVLDNLQSGRMQVYWAVGGLRDVGTQRCIPALKRMLHYPMRDVKDCSILTIAHIAGTTETPFYIDALRDKNTQKAFPMWAIHDAADERAVPAVIEYLLQNRKPYDPNRTLVQTHMCGVAYLAKFNGSDARIEQIIRDFKSRWAALPSQEQRMLLQMHPQRAQLARILGDNASIENASSVPGQMNPD